MSRTMVEADRPIVRAYAELRDVDKVIERLGAPRHRVAEVVVNVCGINPNAARALLTGRQVPYLADRPTSPEPVPVQAADKPKPSAPRIAGVTDAEFRVLLALAAGTTCEQIAADMHKSVTTVRKPHPIPVRPLGCEQSSGALQAAVHLRLIEAPTDINPNHRSDALTAGERDMLQLSANGMSIAQIGEVAHLSTTTVHRRLSRVYAKLSVSRKRDAIETALRLGIINGNRELVA